MVARKRTVKTKTKPNPRPVVTLKWPSRRRGLRSGVGWCDANKVVLCWVEVQEALRRMFRFPERVERFWVNAYSTKVPKSCCVWVSSRSDYPDIINLHQSDGSFIASSWRLHCLLGEFVGRPLYITMDYQE